MPAHHNTYRIVHFGLVLGLLVTSIGLSQVQGRTAHAAPPARTTPERDVSQEDNPPATPVTAQPSATNGVTSTAAMPEVPPFTFITPTNAITQNIPVAKVDTSIAPELPSGGDGTPVVPPRMPDYAALPEQTVVTDTEIVPPQPALANIAFSARGVVAGDVVTANLVLSTSTGLSDLVVTAQLPAGLDYVAASAKTAVYDPATRTLRWANLALDSTKVNQVDTFQLNVTAVGAPATLRVPLRIEGKGLASPIATEPTLQVGVARTAKPQSKGDGATKELKANSRVTLEFAADETLANQDVTVVEYPAEPITNKQQRGLLMQFGPAATFKQPVTLTVNLDDVFSTALLDAGYEPVLIYWPDAPEKVEIIGPDGKPQTVEAIRSRRARHATPGAAPQQTADSPASWPWMRWVCITSARVFTRPSSAGSSRRTASCPAPATPRRSIGMRIRSTRH